MISSGVDGFRRLESVEFDIFLVKIWNKGKKFSKLTRFWKIISHICIDMILMTFMMVIMIMVIMMMVMQARQKQQDNYIDVNRKIAVDSGSMVDS